MHDRKSASYLCDIMKRRQFLTLGLQSLPLLTMGAAFSAQPASLTLPHSTLLALIDTLIPADETPSASGLGLDRQLMRHAETVENYMALLALGCQWLDNQAQASHRLAFAHLTASQRTSIVTLAENSAAGSIPRQLFEHVRVDLFTFYYSHPAILPSLGLRGAPQPFGYPDYASAPKKKV